MKHACFSQRYFTSLATLDTQVQPTSVRVTACSKYRLPKYISSIMKGRLSIAPCLLICTARYKYFSRVLRVVESSPCRLRHPQPGAARRKRGRSGGRYGTTAAGEGSSWDRRPRRRLTGLRYSSASFFAVDAAVSRWLWRTCHAALVRLRSVRSLST